MSLRHSWGLMAVLLASCSSNEPAPERGDAPATHRSTSSALTEAALPLEPLEPRGSLEPLQPPEDLASQPLSVRLEVDDRGTGWLEVLLSRSTRVESVQLAQSFDGGQTYEPLDEAEVIADPEREQRIVFAVEGEAPLLRITTRVDGQLLEVASSQANDTPAPRLDRFAVQVDAATADALWRSREAASTVDELELPRGLRALVEQDQVWAIERLGQAAGAPEGLERILVMLAPPAADRAERLAAYEALDVVDWVQLDQRVHATAPPNDPAYPSQWAPQRSDLETVWDNPSGPSYTGAGQLIAIVDTGVLLTHPDLSGNVVAGGYDFYDNDNDPTDLNGHGTHVAGIAAAVGNNATDVIGAAPDASLLAVRGLGPSGSGDLLDLVAAVQHAANQGATVINNSWGGPGRNPAVDAVVSYAHGLGAVVLSAAGNSNTDAGGFSPANSEHTITVAALNPLDQRAAFSNWGNKIDVTAGGEGILSTYLGNGLSSLSGTSMATPLAAGVAALVREAQPSWGPEEVRQALRQASEDLGAAGFDLDHGYGLVHGDALRVLTQAPAIAHLVEPMTHARVEGTIALTGTLDPAVSTWTLEVGVGIAPTSWTAVAAGTTVPAGALASYDTTLLPDGEIVFRLTVTDAAGQTSEDRNHVYVDNLYLSEPDDGEAVFGYDGVLDVLGSVPSSAAEPVSSWTVSALDATGSWTTLGSGTAAVTGPLGLLGTGLGCGVGPTPLADGPITLRLEGHYPGGRVEVDEHQLTCDALMAPGFPASAPQPRVNPLYEPEEWALRTPLAADLDADGTLEIVYGSAVFEHDGTVRPGFGDDPSVGDSHPVILDLDGDGLLEIISARTESVAGTVQALPFPNYGAPIVEAKREDGTLLWSHHVDDGSWGSFNHGGISSLSADDVDADGQVELVFTMHFTSNTGWNMPTYQLFVLDAVTGTVEQNANLSGRGLGSVSLADLDGDLDLELVTVSTAGVLVMHHDGTPFPGAWPVPSAGNQTAEAILADVDQDDDWEIVVGDQVFHHDGTPLAGWPTTTQHGRTTAAVGFVDDQSCTPAVLSPNATSLSPVFGLGTSVVTLADATGSPMGTTSTTLGENSTLLIWSMPVVYDVMNTQAGETAMADLTGDGVPEMIGHPYYFAQGPHGFHAGLYAAEVAGMGQAPAFPRVVSLGTALRFQAGTTTTDLDGDGDLELITAANQAVLVWDLPAAFDPAASPWRTFQGDLQHTGRYETPLRCLLRPHQVLGGFGDSCLDLGDMDRDGDLDLAVSGIEHSWSGQPWGAVFRNDGGTLSFHNELPPVHACAMSFGDLDGKEPEELVLSGDHSAQGPYGAALAWTPYNNLLTYDDSLPWVGSSLLALGDFNGDSQLDAALSGIDPGPGVVAHQLENIGGGQLASIGPFGPGAPQAEGNALAADLDGDHHDDLVLVGDQGLEVLLSAGGQPQISAYADPDLRHGVVAIGDVDLDGELDVFASGHPGVLAASHAVLLLGQGGGSFVVTVPGIDPVSEGDAEFADADLDGDLDLVVVGLDATGARTATLYLNDGSGGFSPDLDALPDVGGGASEVAWGDIDGDGDPDLAITGTTGPSTGTAEVFVNRTIP